MRNIEFLQYFNELISKNINAYKGMLIEDFEKNPELEYITDQFFMKGVGIMNWLYKSQTKNFLQFSHPFDSKDVQQFYLNDFDNYLEVLDKLSLKEPELYSYFSFNAFEEKSEAEKKYPSAYYMTHENLVERLDNRFLSQLTGSYVNDTTRKACQKEIVKRVNLMIDYHPERIEYDSITSYCFPDICLNIDGFKVNIISDISSLQLRAGNTFILFYINANKETIDENGIVSVGFHSDEPVIYHHNRGDKFIITNSYDRLRKYNAYIEIVIKMYVHYIDLFERWLKEFIVPDILKNKS